MVQSRDSAAALSLLSQESYSTVKFLPLTFLAPMALPLIAVTFLSAVMSGNAEAARPDQNDDVTAMFCYVLYGTEYFSIDDVKRIHETALRNGATQEGVLALAQAARAEGMYPSESVCLKAAQSLK